MLKEGEKNRRMESLGNGQRILMEVLFDQILGHSVLFEKGWLFTSHLNINEYNKAFYCVLSNLETTKLAREAHSCPKPTEHSPEKPFFEQGGWIR